MTKYIIVGITKDNLKKYAKNVGHGFLWYYDHESATHYENHDQALADWAQIVQMNQTADIFKRVFVPCYDPDQPPWA